MIAVAGLISERRSPCRGPSGPSPAVANRRPVKREKPNRLRLALVSGCVLVALLTVQAGASRAGTEPRRQSTPQAQTAPPTSRFVADSRVTLKQLHEKLTGLATQALAGLDTTEPSADEIASQALRVETAKVGLQRATLSREVAEIALKEYQEGVSHRKRGPANQCWKWPGRTWKVADRAVPEARQRYARFKKVKTGSAADLAREWQREAGETVAQLQRKKAQFAVEQAQSKLKVLIEYQHPRDVKNLKANVEKARSHELARQATLELEQSKLKKLERMNDPARSRNLLSDDRKQIVELLVRAIPLEEQLSSRLDQTKADGQPAESVRIEITGLTRELQEIVDRAHDAGTAAAMGRLKSGLRRARGRLALGLLPDWSPMVNAGDPAQEASNGQGHARADSAQFISAQRRRLNKLQDEIVRLGSQALASLDTANRGGVDISMITTQMITVKSAQANFENSRLTREVAEIAIVEYEEGIFKQDQATLEGEVKLAESAAARAADSIEFARGQLAKIKQASRGTAEDLSLEFSYEDRIVQASQREPRDKLALEKARTKLDNLRKYVMPRRVKEIKAEVEKARSDELAKKRNGNSKSQGQAHARNAQSPRS